MEKVSKLIVCPGSFIKDCGEVVPCRRHILQKRQLIWLSNRWIEINKRTDTVRVFVGKHRNERTAKRDPDEIDWLRNVDGIQKLIELADVHIVGKRNRRSIGVTSSVIVVP